METPVKFYTIRDVSSILGIHRVKLRDWIKRRFIEPNGYVPWKNTTRRKAVFTEENLVEIMLFEYLIRWGLSRTKAANLIKWNNESLYKNELILNANTDDGTLMIITRWKHQLESLHAGLQRRGTYGFVKEVG